MDRVDFYFRQKVTAGELNQAFDHAENADKSLASDNGLVGVLSGAAVTAQATPNATVQVGQGVIYSPDGHRMNIPSTQTVNTASDVNAVTTAVTTPGNQRWVSIFVVFDRIESDPRTDGNSQQVWFQQAGTYVFRVVQGIEGPTGSAVRPSLDAGAVLLADVLLTYGSTTVTNGQIDITRRQDAVVANGAVRSVRRGKPAEAIGDVVTIYNNHVQGLADQHAAATVTYAGGSPWADGTTNPAASVEAQLDKVVTDLGTGDGTGKIAAAAVGALLSGTLKAQLSALDQRTVSETRDGAGTYTSGYKIVTALLFPPQGYTAHVGAAYPGASFTWNDTPFDAKSGDLIVMFAELFVQNAGLQDYRVWPEVIMPGGAVTEIGAGGVNASQGGVVLYGATETAHITVLRVTTATVNSTSIAPFRARLKAFAQGTGGVQGVTRVSGFGVFVLRAGGIY